MNICDRDFEIFRDLIYSLCGIYFHTTKKYLLENRLSRCMEATGTKSLGDYLHLLKSPVTKATAMKMLLDEITTNETCFFRNMPQLMALEKLILPEIITQKNKIGFRKLRVWSAGSSSGEEAYTIAMLLTEKRNLLKDWSIEIIGTDINETVLDLAREGSYSGYSVRNTPERYLKAHFKPDSDGRYNLSADIKRMVRFSKLNLYDDAKMLFMKSFDLIFCANVLIYFDIASKTKVVQHFYNNLQPYGYLFVGQSESLHGINEKFKTIHFPSGFAYKK